MIKCSLLCSHILLQLTYVWNTDRKESMSPIYNHYTFTLYYLQIMNLVTYMSRKCSKYQYETVQGLISCPLL